MASGKPNTWARHPCNEGEWSNDEDEYKELESLVVPCPPSSTRPVSTGSNNANGQQNVGEDGNEEEDGSKFIVEGRPDGFRPGVGISSATSLEGAGSSSTSSNARGGGAAAAAAVSAAVAAIAVLAFLLVRKRRKNSDEATVAATAAGLSDKATLIYDLEEPTSSSVEAAKTGTATADNSFESNHCEDGDGDEFANTRSAADTSIDSDIGAILADIESFGGERLVAAGSNEPVAAAAAAPKFSPSSWNGADGAIELDPEAAAAYLASGSAAATTASASAAAIALGTNQDESIDSSTTQERLDSSFVSANSKDLGRRHSATNVCFCASSTCAGCSSSLSVNVGKVDFIRADTPKLDNTRDINASF